MRLSELAGIRYDPGDLRHSDVDLWHREITLQGKGPQDQDRLDRLRWRPELDRCIRVRAGHAQAYRPQLWLGINNRGT
jgi:hypothetical protein